MHRKFEIHSKQKNFFVLFRCRHCGKLNVVLHVVRGESQSALTMNPDSDGDAYASKRRAEEFCNYNWEKILREAKKKQYRTLKSACSCSNCNKRPLWARFSYRFCDRLTRLGIYLAGIVFLFSLLVVGEMDLDEYVSTFVPVLSVLAGGALVIKLGVLVHRTVLEGRVRALPEKFLPEFAESAEEVKAITERMQTEH